MIKDATGFGSGVGIYVGTSVVGSVEGDKVVGVTVDLNTGKLLGIFVGALVLGFNVGSFVITIVGLVLGKFVGALVDK